MGALVQLRKPIQPETCLGSRAELSKRRVNAQRALSLLRERLCEMRRLEAALEEIAARLEAEERAG